MYSIDPTKAKIRDARKDSITHYNIDPSHPYDLPNQNIYDAESGDLIEAATADTYDLAFVGKLLQTNPIYNIEQILNHHLSRTPDQVVFIKHITRQVTLYFSKDTPKNHAIKKEILQWANKAETAVAEGKVELPFENFPDNNLKIYPERFQEIERWLVRQKYLDVNGKWIHESQDLAALVQFLIDKDVFRMSDKESKGERTKVRKIFETRYRRSFAEQFKPSNITGKDAFDPELTRIINPVSR